MVLVTFQKHGSPLIESKTFWNDEWEQLCKLHPVPYAFYYVERC